MRRGRLRTCILRRRDDDNYFSFLLCRRRGLAWLASPTATVLYLLVLRCISDRSSRTNPNELS